MEKSILWAMVIALTTCAIARADNSSEIAQNLGDVLASEEACGFSFDQSAIASYITKNVSASDMAFAGKLDSYTNVRKSFVSDMSASSKMAFCTQEGRVAKEFGFLK